MKYEILYCPVLRSQYFKSIDLVSVINECDRQLASDKFRCVQTSYLNETSRLIFRYFYTASFQHHVKT